jgi:hypothetical protein
MKRRRNYRDLFDFELAYNIKDGSGEVAEQELNEIWKEKFNRIDWGRNNSRTIDEIDAIGAKVIEYVERVVDLYNPISLFYDMREGELGKTLEVHETLGGRVYERAYGGYSNISQLKKNKYTVTTKPWSIHMRFSVEELKTGVTTLTDINANISAAILTHKVKLAIDTLIFAYATTGNYVTDAGGSIVTQSALNAVIDGLMDRGSGQILMLGRHKAIGPIKTFSGNPQWSDANKGDIQAKGFVTKYNGSDVVAVGDYSDDVYGIQPLTSKNVFLIDKVKKFNAFVEVGGLERTAYNDVYTNEFGIIVRFEDGAAVWKSKYGHRIHNLP